MKKFFLCLLILILLSGVGFAQTKGFSALFGYRTSFVSSSKEPKVRSSEFYAAAGYNFNSRFSLRAQGEGPIHLFKNKGIRDYQRGVTLGLSAGYNVVSSGWEILEINATVGNTLWGNDWHYMYADGGVRWAFGKSASRVFAGIGARYYNSQSAGFKSFWNGYLTVGFRFN